MANKSNNLKSLLSSLPAILTATAAVITAVGGVLTILYGVSTIDYFYANPITIDSGESVKLTWSVSDANYVTINPGVGIVELEGSKTVFPTETTTYILKAIKKGKPDFDTVTVTVKDGNSSETNPENKQENSSMGLPVFYKIPPIIESFEANPDNITSGEDVTLSWDVSYASDVTINPGVGSVNLNGSKIVYPTENTTYTLKATNGVEGVNSSKTVFVEKPNLGVEFVRIPTGKFMMGSPSDELGRQADEGPVHEVTIEAFELGKYEITQKQWVEVMGRNPSKWTGDDLPVEHVSKNDVEEFIEKLNEKEGTDKYRLPTEAEWEYACRAGTTTTYSFGNDESKLGNYAWYSGNSHGNTHPVGQKKPNDWDLYDMYGNVWEWVQDDYHNSYDSAPYDGSAWGSGETSRGGSYYTLAKFCRSANRNNYDPQDTIGFRLVKEI